jgi:hypothetical protein
VLYQVETESRLSVYSDQASKESGGVFAWFKGLASQKTLTRESVEPVLEKMREHLIGWYNLLLVHDIIQNRGDMYSLAIILKYGSTMRPLFYMYWWLK